jgi:regulator of protease activity HflC (stomatin/prohibitin superfamily)
MEKQMRAERERRESILKAEGEKQSAILQAEAAKEAAIREAEGEAQAILNIQKATADGLSMLKAVSADEALIKLKSLEALQKVADGQSTKIIIPSDIQNFAGLITSAVEIARK